ncbi:MAG: ABC transporter ATP-binding protein/permease [Chloroflexi bacterium]|nr:ABC transporter ATP-binding protein/permease [Chloroflexota bacterium]
MMHDRGWWSYIRYDDKQDRPEVTWALLRRVWRYALPYALQVGLMLVVILASTLLGLIPPLLYRDLIDHTLPQHDFQRLNLLALGMIAVPLATGLLGVYQRYLSSRVGEGTIYDLRRALFEHMQRMSLRFFTHTRTGELMSRLNNDVVGAQQAVTTTLVSIFTNTVAVVSTLAIMFSLEWRLTLASVVILPLFLLPSRRIGQTLRRITRESLSFNAQMNALMNETLNVSGALLVKLFGRGKDEQGRFDERAAHVRDIGVTQAVISRWFFLTLSLVTAVGTALVFWFGGVLVLQDAFTVGTIVAFGAYLTQLYGPLSSLTNARVEFATSMVSFERVFEVLDLPVEIKDKPGAVELGSVAGNVQFEDVSFSYESPEGVPSGLSEVRRWDMQSALTEPARQRRLSGQAAGLPDGRFNPELREGEARPVARVALSDISFTIKPGQLAALVGPSGAGKTTITYLLPRLYDPTGGRILIDGHDIRDVSQRSLATQIGMVTQETYLFHDTIRTNLLYAKPDATQAQLDEACRSANIHDFIAGLPEGYETIVGERGYRLSGGEKQRLAIARVLLKDPRILVLDEATSHLDSQSEALIQAALERVMEGRTSLVIAHRLSTVLAADLILVLAQGRLVEQGAHEQLLQCGGLYASLYETQFRRGTRSPEPAATE